MTRAFISALATYNRLRFWLPVAAGILWMGFVGWLVSGQQLAPVDFLRFNGLILIVYAIMLGYHLNVQFRSCRSHLVPHYGAAHVLAAFGVILFVALLVIGTATASWGGHASVASQWKGVLPFNVAVAWSVALLCIWMGYSARPWSVFAVPLLLFGLVMFRDGTGFQQFLSIIEGNRTQGIAFLVVMNLALSVAFIRRVLRMNEEMPEYRVQYLFDSREAYKQMRHAATDDRTFLQRRFGRFDERLDEIRWPLGQGFVSRLWHFQLGQPFQVSILPLTVFMVLLLWSLRAFIGERGTAMHLWWIYPAFVVFSQWKRARLQWICMLPFRRREIVVLYGGAFLLSVMKMWFLYNLALYIAGWMPSPGAIRGIPAIGPFALSLAVQLLAFGIATLFGRPRSVNPFVVIAVCIAVPLAGIATGLVLVVVAGRERVRPVLGFLGSVGAAVGETQLLIILTVTAALGVIWYSYRNWCQSEID